MQDFKAQKIKKVLKDLLKKKKITYESLAEQLHCSIPTVKRVLGSEELTLNRLLQICEVLDIDFSDLEALTKEVKDEIETFTREQEEFLSKNKPHFAYLMKLFDGKSPKQIAEAHHLTQRSTDKYLIGLEKHGLIRVTGKQKVKPVFKTVPALRKGPLAKMYSDALVKNASTFFSEVIREGVHSSATSESTPASNNFGIYSFKMTKSSYAFWLDEQIKALKNLENLSRFEEKTHDSQELMTAVVLSANALVENDHRALALIDNTFGDVPNL